jgi:transcriptional regulator
MYTPPAFREDDTAALHAMIAASRLALLVSNGEEGLPQASHLPLLLDAGRGVLTGHLARANPHWRGLQAAGRALAVFTGPEAYVTPAWYASKAEHGRVVPTWNYVAIEAAGSVQVFEDAERLRGVVAALTAHHEAGRAAPWAVTDAPPDFVQAQLKGIVGIELRIERLTGKRKLSQNRAAADVQGVRDGLGASADPRDRAVAAAMEGRDVHA